MLGELDFYLPKSFCSTNVYGEYTEGKDSIVGLTLSHEATQCNQMAFDKWQVCHTKKYEFDLTVKNCYKWLSNIYI